MRANPFRGPLEEPWTRLFRLWNGHRPPPPPSNTYQYLHTVWRWDLMILMGANPLHRANPFPMALEMDLPASKALRIAPYKPKVYFCIWIIDTPLSNFGIGIEQLQKPCRLALLCMNYISGCNSVTEVHLGPSWQIGLIYQPQTLLPFGRRAPLKGAI